MGNSATSGRITLGELVWGLAAGQPCPCCGQVLKCGPMQKGLSERSQYEMQSVGTSVVVYCPECGCEVVEGPDGYQAGLRQAMASAA